MPKDPVERQEMLQTMMTGDPPRQGEGSDAEAMNGSCAVRGGVEALCAAVSREDHGALGVERLSEGWAARRTRQRVTWGS